MALIVEVLDRRSGDVRYRTRVASFPFTLGRGYGNDLILDDPYIDARHARIAIDEAGSLVIEDLGSRNGIAGGAGTRETRLTIRPGETVRLGHTTLRFRDPDEPVVPALLDVAGPGSTPATLGRLSTVPRQMTVIVAAAAAFAGFTWLGTYERSSGSVALSAALVLLGFAASWAGVWAIAGRIVVHRFRYLEHLTIASIAGLASLVLLLTGEWVAFLAPDNVLWTPIELAAAFVWVVLLISAHLALASFQPMHTRRSAGVIAATIIIGLTGIVSLIGNDEFSDVPEFSGMLKPLPASLVPAGTVDDLTDVVTGLREKAGKLAEER